MKLHLRPLQKLLVKFVPLRPQCLHGIPRSLRGCLQWHHGVQIQIVTGAVRRPHHRHTTYRPIIVVVAAKTKARETTALIRAKDVVEVAKAPGLPLHLLAAIGAGTKAIGTSREIGTRANGGKVATGKRKGKLAPGSR